MNDYKALLEPDGIYHVYNCANGTEKLFVNDGNYIFFLEKYKKYVAPLADTFCYCLLPNHFHFLVRIKSEKNIEAHLLQNCTKHSKTLEGFRTLQGLAKHASLTKYLSQQFGHLFNGYTQAFNKQQDRKGNLFMHNFNRKPVTDENYRCKLVHYIHYNPVEAKLCSKPEDWRYSSYNAIVAGKNTLVQYAEVIRWFDNRENFVYCHKQPPEITGIDIWA